MKKYIEPTLELQKFDVQDVITTSFGEEGETERDN